MNVSLDSTQIRQYSGTRQCHVSPHHRHSLAYTSKRQRRQLSHTCPATAQLASLFDFARPKPKPPKLPPANEPEFQNWLEKQGLPSQQVDLADTGDAGRGLVGRQRIKENEAILRVPEGILLTAEVARREAKLGQLLRKAGVPDWSALATLLVEVRHDGSSSSSRWAPYVAVLPSTCGCVLEWPRNEVSQLLRGSPALRQAQELIAAADSSWQELEGMISEAEESGLIQPDIYTRQAYTWAFSMLLSRLVRLPGRNNEEALVPWADFLNHSSTAGSFLDYEPSLSSVVLRPAATVYQGAQVFASYGEKSNAELLLSYGFLLDSNLHDCYRLTLAVPARDPVTTRRPSSQAPASDQLVQEALHVPHREAKLAALERLGRSRETSFPLRTSGTPEGLLQFAAFLAAGEKQGVVAADVVGLGELLLGGAGFAGVSKRQELERAGAQQISDCCRAALKQYPRPLAEEQEFLAAANRRAGEAGGVGGDKDSPTQAAAKRAFWASSIRVQEQKILHRTIFILQESYGLSAAKRALAQRV